MAPREPSVIPRLRRIVTVTSPNDWASGACGLCTVISTSRTASAGQAGRGQPLGQRLDQRYRLAGDDGGEPVRDRGVVDGMVRSSAAAAGRVSSQSTASTTNSWPSRRS